MSTEASAGRRIAVVTVVSGRHAHLRAQRRGLAAAQPPPREHVVVAVGDAGIADVVAEQPSLPTTLVELATTPAGLPVAAARNHGAAAALAGGADIVIFLDVDCIPGPGLVDTYRGAVAAHPDAVLCGAVTYLPPAPAGGWTAPALAAARAPHAARPDPRPGHVTELAPALFWSLSFALSGELWHRIGGFHEGYVGYGGEDTDFAATATRLGVPILMAGGADAFHQHHPVSDPPREHLDDIVRNSGIYRRRHGTVPMRGWLDAFAADGLIGPDADGVLRRVDAPRVLTVPARHPYLDAAVPATVRRVAVDRVVGWEPDPMLEPERLETAASGIDVIHVHFGYDHLSPAALAAWLATVGRLEIPLVVTVHDLRNPHHDDPARHHAHLGQLLAAATYALTLTDAAADECARRYGRRPEVVPHPPVVTGDAVPAVTAAPEILLPLKNLRRNVVEPVALVHAAADAAADHGARLRVLVEPAAWDGPRLHPLHALARERAATMTVDVRPYLAHDQLCELLARTHACVLPYRFGTHSGWVELARDLGVHVLAPDCGHYASQWPAVRIFGNNERDGLDARSLNAAVADACRAPRPAPASASEREALGDLIRARHDALYRRLGGR